MLFLRRRTWKQTREVLASEKWFHLIDVITHFLNQLSWNGAVRSRPRFCVQKQQELENSGNYIAGVEQKTTYQTDSPKKEKHKKLFAKADSSIDKTLSCPPIKLSNLQKLIVKGSKTGVLLPDFLQQQRPKNAEVSDVDVALFDAAGSSLTMVLMQNARAKERKSWSTFKLWTSEHAKVVHRGWCCFWVCAQFSEN